MNDTKGNYPSVVKPHITHQMKDLTLSTSSMSKWSRPRSQSIWFLPMTAFGLLRSPGAAFLFANCSYSVSVAMLLPIVGNLPQIYLEKSRRINPRCNLCNIIMARLESLVDVHPEGCLQAHVHVVGLEALGGVTQRGEVRGPCSRVAIVANIVLVLD